MENHFHLVVMTPEGNLSQWMHQLKTAYTLLYQSSSDPALSGSLSRQRQDGNRRSSASKTRCPRCIAVSYESAVTSASVALDAANACSLAVTQWKTCHLNCNSNLILQNHCSPQLQSADQIAPGRDVMVRENQATFDSIRCAFATLGFVLLASLMAGFEAFAADDQSDATN